MAFRTGTPSSPSSAPIPAKSAPKEIAREFGLKNADRAELKRILRELADSGTIKKHGKKVTERAQLPATLLADITTRDADGELIATPAEWDEAEGGEPPRIRIHIPRHARPGTMAGVGDRALLRIERVSGDDVAYRGRIIKVIDHAKTRVLGVFRAATRWRRPADPRRQEAGRQGAQYRARQIPAAQRTAISSASTS